MKRTNTIAAQLLGRRRGMGLAQMATSVGVLVGLTTTIFVPALIGLRDRNRQALCTARIGLLTRAMLTYAADYNETPPFMGIGWENLPSPNKPLSGAPGDMSSMTSLQWAKAETWVTQHPDLLWNGTLPESEWAANGVGLSTGLLFPYARSEEVYRCPEFEREPNTSQSAFNYTRTLLGRKWIMGDWSTGGREPDYWGSSDFGAPGPIMRISEIHRPALLAMQYDEWHWRHVASPHDQHVPPREALASGGWAAVDCMHFFLADEIGRYHGRPARTEWLHHILDEILVKRGNTTYYDGHVELTRDFWPDKSMKPEPYLYYALYDIFRYMSNLTFAQRGKVMISGPL